jgi:raffinose/stachyose/melibiose transport system substrate-binding protein
MKRLFVVLLFLVLATSMVFAGGNRDAGARAGVQTVTIYHHMGEQAKRDALQAWADEVTRRNPNYRFEITVISDANEYRAIIRTRIAAGDPPDIMFGAVRDYVNLVEAGHIMDITNMSFTRNFEPHVIEGSRVNGRIYGVPVDFGLIMVFYNKDIFNRFNLQVPRTYAEFLQVCRTLQANGVNPLALGFRDGWTAGVDFMQEWYMILNRHPNFFRDIDAGRARFADFPEFRRAVERSRERFQFALANPFGTSNDESIQMFAAGRAAMLPNGTWSVATVRELNPQGNFGLFALPADREADTVARLFTDDCFMISSRTRNIDAVTAFFEYALSPEGMNLWTEKTSLIPAVPGITLRNPHPMVADAQNQINSGRTIFADTVYQPTGQLFDIFFGRFSADFLADQTRTIDQWIAELDAEYAAAARALR